MHICVIFTGPPPYQLHLWELLSEAGRKYGHTPSAPSRLFVVEDWRGNLVYSEHVFLRVTSCLLRLQAKNGKVDDFYCLRSLEFWISIDPATSSSKPFSNAPFIVLLRGFSFGSRAVNQAFHVFEDCELVPDVWKRRTNFLIGWLS